MKDLIKASLIRTLWTFFEAVVATVGGSATLLSDVNWTFVLSASVFAAIIAFCKCMITGLPEVKYSKMLYQYHDEPADSEVFEDED